MTSLNIKHIKGNTFYIDTGTLYIPFYKINNEEIIMLDTGWKEGEREKLERLLEYNKLRVAAIINSHAHRDHIGNNAYFKEKYNSIIAMPTYEAIVCSSAANLKLFFGRMDLKEVREHYGYLVCKTDIMISEEQDSIFIGEACFRIFHTPGHSPAHICIVTPDDVAYLGDALISYEVMAEAKLPYVTILSEDLKSKEKLLDLKCSRYVLAHKSIYTDIFKVVKDNIDFYKVRAEKVYELIEGAMTIDEIIKAASESFRIRTNTVDKYIFIERMLKPYLEYLCETEKIRLIVEDGILKYTVWFSESKWKKYTLSDYVEENI
jgi:glyoxylase-like metal-dependent hydrolase (beta-lactamase superfamily II)